MNLTLLERLGVELGVGRRDLLRVILTAPARYKVYQIPKRSGGKRTIAQPSRELKQIQRYVLNELLQNLPVHAAATAYRRNQGIKSNALPHLGSFCILKLDFENFFPSILVRDWDYYVRKHRLLPDAIERDLYRHILFWGKGTYSPQCLSIGAPTSPAISNILLYELDSILTEKAEALGVKYTRYADDITASAPNIHLVEKFEKVARREIHRLRSPKLTFNEAKRGLYTTAQRRMVTGLILTPVGSVSIGRERKRLISAMLHHAVNGDLDREGLLKLKGLLGFSIAAEPTFVDRMKAKYGAAAVHTVLTYEPQ